HPRPLPRDPTRSRSAHRYMPTRCPRSMPMSLHRGSAARNCRPSCLHYPAETQTKPALECSFVLPQLPFRVQFCQGDPMNMAALASELVRALRGQRTQRAFAKRLGCSENVVYTWEAGRRFPSASRFLQIVRGSGINLPTALSRFLRTTPTWLDGNPSDPDCIVELLNEARGNRSLLDIAKAADRSRFRVARWFWGATQPRLRDLCLLIH